MGAYTPPKPVCWKCSAFLKKLEHFSYHYYLWVIETCCPSQCWRNVANSTFFRQFENRFLSTIQVFGTFVWAFSHLRSLFWPFLCAFGTPETPRKFYQKAPNRCFKARIWGKMVKKVGFLTKYQKRSLDQSFIPKALLLFGNASKRARTCFNTLQAQVCVP